MVLFLGYTTLCIKGKTKINNIIQTLTIEEMAPVRENPSKRWCFTINNYTQQECDNLVKELTMEKVVYAVVGWEVCENGSPHLQGFVNLKVKRRLTTLKASLNARAHYEQAKGNDDQNRQYCTQGGDLNELNEMPHVTTLKYNYQ